MRQDHALPGTVLVEGPSALSTVAENQYRQERTYLNSRSHHTVEMSDFDELLRMSECESEE